MNPNTDSHSDLFRKEAVEFSTQRLYGDVVVLPKISHHMVFWTLLGIIALLVMALIKGVSVERHTIDGRLIIHSQETSVELYVPVKYSSSISPGQRLTIVPLLTSSADERTMRLDATVTTVGKNSQLLSTGPNVAAMVYVPVTLQVTEASMLHAGLPLHSDTELAVRSMIETGRKSWLRWFLDLLNHQQSPA